MSLRPSLLLTLAFPLLLPRAAAEPAVEIGSAAAHLPGRRDVIAPGGSVELRVPSPVGAAVTWYRDAVRVASTISGTLALAGLTPADTGNYRAEWSVDGRLVRSGLVPVSVGPLPRSHFAVESTAVGQPAGPEVTTLERALPDRRVLATTRVSAEGVARLDTRLFAADFLSGRTLHSKPGSDADLLGVLDDGSYYLASAPYRYREPGVPLPFTLPAVFADTPPRRALGIGAGRIALHNVTTLVIAGPDGAVFATAAARDLGLLGIADVVPLADGQLGVHGTVGLVEGLPPTGVTRRVTPEATLAAGAVPISNPDPARPPQPLADGSWARLRDDRLERYAANGQPLTAQPPPVDGFAAGLRLAASGEIYALFEGLGVVRFRAGSRLPEADFFLPQDLLVETQLAPVLVRGDATVAAVVAPAGVAPPVRAAAAAADHSGAAPVVGREVLVYGQAAAEFSARLHPFTPDSEFRPQAGRGLRLYCPFFGSGSLAIGWTALDGTLVPPPAPDHSLEIPSFSAAYAGRYQLVVSNARGRALGPVVDLRPRGQSRLANLSGRALVDLGDRAAIAGFVLRPSASGAGGPARLLLRSAGPALSEFGVTRPLEDPVLRLYRDTGALVAENDDWDRGSGLGEEDFQRVGAFAFRAGARDAALARELAAGGYTALTTGRTVGAGIALNEVYLDAGAGTPGADLANLSLRGVAGAGENVLVGGFVIEDPDRLDRPVRLLVRAAGPALAAFGVGGPLPDPVLRLFNVAREPIAVNDDWGRGGLTEGELVAAAASVGAFAFASGSKDAALVVTLPPGSYTAHIEPGGTADGIALLELYRLP